MSDYLPKLDPAPKGKPVGDWRYGAIQKARLVKTRPLEYKNPYYKEVCQRDQKDRGTCCGMMKGYAYDILYCMLTHDLPTPEDKSKHKKNVTDSLGTLCDILYPQSASAEQAYQKSRQIGGITDADGEGSEIRYIAREWTEYGTNTEPQWHTAKTPYNVWEKPHQTADGGLSVIEATSFAEQHRAEGYAVVGNEYGTATWDEVCQAIYEKGFVLSGIPCYSNYGSIAGTDGTFPDPKGSIVGYHALLMYGYDENKIYLLHSWGDWCGMYGSISKTYFNKAAPMSVFMVILDSEDTRIAREVVQYVSLTVNVRDYTTKEPVQGGEVYVNGILVGTAPQTIAVERGIVYEIEGRGSGYRAQKTNVQAPQEEQSFTVNLDLEKEIKKGLLQMIIEFIMYLLTGKR